MKDEIIYEAWQERWHYHDHTENRVCWCNVYWAGSTHSPVVGVYDNWKLTDRPTNSQVTYKEVQLVCL
jgi:hypothetical protein